MQSAYLSVKPGRMQAGSPLTREKRGRINAEGIQRSARGKNTALGDIRPVNREFLHDGDFAARWMTGSRATRKAIYSEWRRSIEAARFTSEFPREAKRRDKIQNYPPFVIH